MSKLEDYFRTDQHHYVTVDVSAEIIVAATGLCIPVRIIHDFSSGSVYFAIYLSDDVTNPLAIIAHVLLECDLYRRLVEKVPAFAIDIFGEGSVESPTLQFTGRIYIYSERSVEPDQLKRLVATAGQRGLFIQLFSSDWRRWREETERPIAFISHDSRDKVSMAAPLAQELMRRQIPVWFSEYSLHVGDSLRESIERGLRECKFCVLLLTPNFLANSGWTRAEFTAVFTRELVEESKIILPIRAGVSTQEVLAYSPILADRFALTWQSDPGVVADHLAAAIRTQG